MKPGHSAVLLGVLMMTVSRPIVTNAAKPPQPVYAAEQPDLTIKSMQAEAEQFRAIARLQSSQSRLHSILDQRDQAKREWELARSVTGKGQLSASEILQLELNYQNLESLYGRAENEVQRYRLQVASARYDILHEGNPGQDDRLSLAIEMLESMKMEIEYLKASQKNAGFSLSFYRQRYENGLYLFARQVISRVELDRRKVELNAALDRVESLAQEAKAAEQAAEAIQKNIRRLSNTKQVGLKN
jgi:hypothetical protein